MLKKIYFYNLQIKFIVVQRTIFGRKGQFYRLMVFRSRNVWESGSLLLITRASHNITVELLWMQGLIVSTWMSQFKLKNRNCFPIPASWALPIIIGKNWLVTHVRSVIWDFGNSRDFGPFAITVSHQVITKESEDLKDLRLLGGFFGCKTITR